MRGASASPSRSRRDPRPFDGSSSAASTQRRRRNPRRESRAVAVFTVMAEETDGTSVKLHNEAVRLAAYAVATVDRFRQRKYANIRIYRETEEISEGELRGLA